MSSMVERLAKKWAAELEGDFAFRPERDARWWLYAVADELGEHIDSFPPPVDDHTDGIRIGFRGAADHLRNQAGTADD